MTLLELINEIVPEERGTILVCIRSLESSLGGQLEHFFTKVLPVLRKHNIQERFETNTNGLGGVWLRLDKYVVSKPNHGISNWGFQYEAVLELCKFCNIKISTDTHNYILDVDGNVIEKVEVMDDV